MWVLRLICLSLPPFCLTLSSEEVPSLMSAAALTCFYSWSSTLPPRSPACCHSNTSIRTAATPFFAAYAPTQSSPSLPSPSTAPSWAPASAFLTGQPVLLTTSWPALTLQPSTPPGPHSISHTLPFTFAFDPWSLHTVLSVLNLFEADYTPSVAFVACFTAPNQSPLICRRE